MNGIRELLTRSNRAQNASPDPVQIAEKRETGLEQHHSNRFTKRGWYYSFFTRGRKNVLPLIRSKTVIQSIKIVYRTGFSSTDPELIKGAERTEGVCKSLHRDRNGLPGTKCPYEK